MDINEEITRGYRASELLENPIYKEACDKVREGIITAWENAPIRDKEGQHELRLMLKCLKDMQKHIENVAMTGKMAKIQLDTPNLVSRLFKNKV